MVKSGYPMDIADAGMVHQNPYPHTHISCLFLYMTRGSFIILEKKSRNLVLTAGCPIVSSPSVIIASFPLPSSPASSNSGLLDQ